MQYQPLWLELSPWEAVSTLTRGSTKPRTAALTPEVHYAPGKTSPIVTSLEAASTHYDAWAEFPPRTDRE